jgi:HSP20 family protein
MKSMALFSDPFEALVRLQQTMDTLRSSDWLNTGPSAAGAFPPVNAFRKGDDYVLIAELPGVDRDSVDIQVKGNTIRLGGRKPVNHIEKASQHRRERLAGTFDRAVTLPVELNAEGVKAEYRDGILALFVPRAEQDKPRSIRIA